MASSGVRPSPSAKPIHHVSLREFCTVTFTILSKVDFLDDGTASSTATTCTSKRREEVNSSSQGIMLYHWMIDSYISSTICYIYETTDCIDRRYMNSYLRYNCLSRKIHVRDELKKNFFCC